MDQTMEIMITQLPNFTGLLFCIGVLWRLTARQQSHIDALMEKCLKDDCDDAIDIPTPN